MPGTIIGGRKAAATNKARHGDDFYKRIGRIGGSRSTTGGFASNRELAREAGRKGGAISRRRRASANVTPSFDDGTPLTSEQLAKL